MRNKKRNSIDVRIAIVPIVIAVFATFILTLVSFSKQNLTANYEPQALAATKTVASASQVQSAINAAQAGDVILLGDMSVTSTITISNTRGTSEKPILVKAVNSQKVNVTGSGQIVFKNAKNITLEGINFSSRKYNHVLIDSSENIRLTRNYFHAEESTSVESVWVYVKGVSRNVRIDHNEFRDKKSSGRFIAVHGDGKNMAQNTRIDRNHFKNITPRVSNGKEAIQIGLAEYTYASASTVIENNLFEGCDGDPEIVSVKSSNNIIQNNTFIENQGMLVLRHGNNNTVRNNLFFGNKYGAGGVRVHGENHQIQGNYFEDIQGINSGGAIVVPEGNQDSGSTELKGHFRAVNTKIENNIVLNSDFGIVIGSGYGKPPRNTQIANNIISSNRGTLFQHDSRSENTTWSNNKAYATGTAQVGVKLASNQLQITNPQIKPYSTDGGSSIRAYNNALHKLSASDVGPLSEYDAPQVTPKPVVTQSPAQSPTVGQSQVVIAAAGRYSGTTYPNMNVLLNDTVVKSFTVNTTTIKDYNYTFARKVAISELKFAFTNDGESRDLRIDRVTLDGTVYESTAPTVFSTGTWSSSNGCGDGYKQSVWLNCPGYFLYK